MAITRSYGVTVLVLFLLSVFAWILSADAYGGMNEKEQELHVMTFNIGNIEGSKRVNEQHLVNYLRSPGAMDILLLQEVGATEIQLLGIALDMPFSIFLGNGQKNSQGVGILSRIPLTNTKSLIFKNSLKGAGALRATVKFQGLHVTLVNTHLDRIRSVSIKNGIAFAKLKTVMTALKNEVVEDTPRSRMIRELIAWLEEDRPQYLILGGDLNTIPLAKPVRQLYNIFDDVLWPSLDFFKGTYTKFRFPVKPRIDYLMVSSNLSVSAAKIVSQSPGDHLPVKAVIRIPARDKFFPDIFIR